MMANVTSSSAVDRSILVTDIPFDTDDSGKLTDVLKKYFGKKKIGGGDVQRVICPLGGTMTKALVVFEYVRVTDTILKNTHQLGGEEIQVTRLPPIFSEVRGALGDFYFSILPRNKFRELVGYLRKIFDSDHLQTTKYYKVTEITGTTDHLKEAAECLLEAIGMTGVRDGSDTADITERCLDIDNIPYMTDEVTQIKEELGVYFKRNGGEVQSVICPIMGKSTRAIVIFKSIHDRNHFLKRLQDVGPSFYDNTLEIHELPKVFTEVIAEVDTFYVKNLSKSRMEKLRASMSERFGPSFTKDGKILSGSLVQICDAGILTMQAIGLEDEDTSGLAMTAQPGLKQTLRGKHRTTGGVSKKEGFKENLHEHIHDEPLQDVSATVSAQTDESTSTQVHPGTAKPCASSGGRSDEAGSEPSQNKHMRDAPWTDVSTTASAHVYVSRQSSQTHPGAAIHRNSGGRFDEAGYEPSQNIKHGHDDPSQDVTSNAQVKSTHKHPSASRPMHNTQDVNRSAGVDANGTNRIQLAEGHVGNPRCAANFPNDPKSIREPFTEQTEVPDNQQGMDDKTLPDEASSNRDSSVSGAPILEAALKDCFLTVDKMRFQYCKRNFKTEFQKIETTYDVKIKLSSRDSKDENELLVELQAKSSKGAKTKQKKDNVLMAQEEFVRLYSDIHSATHKASVPFNATDDKKLHKIQDRITKSFPSVIVAWNETECILCGENATVEKAQQLMKDVISEYETFSVDKIAYRYLSTVNKGKLDNIKKSFHVTIELKQDTAQNQTQQAVHIKPSKNKKKMSAEDLRKAKDEFISLYQVTFFSIKRMPVKCLGISKKAVNDASEQTKKIYPDVLIITEDSPNEVIICAEEKDLDDVVRAFRNSAGLVSKRRLKKSSSNDMEQPDLSHQDEVQSTSSDRDPQIPSSAHVDSSSPSSVFVTLEGLQIIVVTGDITKQDVDVIVNAANETLNLNGGVAKAISTAAGPQLQRECKDVLRGKYLAVGDCVVTNAFRLHCKRVVHAVGPRYKDYIRDFSSELAKTFSKLLLKSDVELCAKSIAIPLISSGTYGGPKQKCAEVLMNTLQEFSRKSKERHLQQVYLVNIDEETTSILQKVCGGIFLPKHHPTNADTLQESTQAKGKAKSAIQRTSYKISNGLEIFVDSGDITQTRVEVIVNAANKHLRHGRGVAGAIAKAAGTELQEESNRIMKYRQPLQPEECVMTDGYKLKCRILHIVGPVYKDCNSDKEFFQYLKATFLSALRHVNLPVEAKDVAIPLVSSGIYGGPKQICAEALLDAIEEFNKEHTLVVKRIYLINLDDDATEALQKVFNRRYSRGLPINSSTQAPTGHASQSQPSHGIDVQVVKGDITMQYVDVIVNPTDVQMNNNIGAAKAISAVAGPKLQERCRLIMKTRKNQSLVTGEVTETAGYRLKCKHILHTPSPFFNRSIGQQRYEDMLIDIFLTCLRMANNLGQSIAIPLIGAGHNGAPKELCAHALMKAIEDFDKSINPKVLKKVVIISIDKEAVLAAQMSITNYFPNYSKRDEVPNREPSAHAQSVEVPPVDALPADAPPTDAPPTGRFQTDEGLLLVNSLGHITNQPSDVMISCTDERLNHEDGISSSINEAAGPELRREYKESIKKRRSHLKPGEMIATSGYKLQCQQVLHVIEPKIEAIDDTLLSSLLFAGGTLSAKKVILPLMGSAVGRSSIGECAQKTVNAVKRFSRMKTSIREIHFINVGLDETSELHKALSATFKRDNAEGYQHQENTKHPQSGASNAYKYQGNTNGRESVARRVDSNDPLMVTTSQTGRHNINHLDQGAVPKGPQQHQTMQDTVSSVSTTYGYMSSFFKPVVDVFYPASNSTVTTSAATQPVTSSRVGATHPPVTVSVTFTGSGVAQPSVTPHGTGSVAAQYSVIPRFPSTGSGAAQNPVTLPATTQSYASVTRSQTSPSDVANPSKHIGCGKCWAQTNCKLLEGCGHMFCRNCIVGYIAPNSRCLTCSSLYCVTREETLKGTMTYFIKDDIKISGQSESGAIVIKYQFPDGFSAVHHGRQYNGNSFEAYLPNNADGLEIAWLLRTAFVAGHTFTVTSFRGGPLQVNWSSIPHKVNITGGIRDFGYPDPEYLMRVRDVLKDKHGIVSNISSTRFNGRVGGMKIL